MECYKVEKSTLIVSRNLDEALEEIANSLRNSCLIFFFGAGISLEYPSLLPLSDNCELSSNLVLPGLKQLIRNMLFREAGIENILTEKGTNEVKRLALEVLLDFISRTIGETSLEFYDILKPKYLKENYGPNYRHYFLALMAKYGYCRHFITVNFDNLVENAFHLLGVPLIVPEQMGGHESKIYSNALRYPNKNNYLYKLHGTLDETEDPQNTKLLATVEMVGIGLPSYKTEFLQSVSANYDIFFMGYSNNDIDVFPVIARTKSNKKVIWHTPKKSILDNQSFKEIIKFLSHREHYILVGDLSKILHNIAKRLNLDLSTIIFPKINISSFDEIKIRERELALIRINEINTFIDYYTRKYFFHPATARLILANILEKPGLWEIAEKLLQTLRGDIPKNNFDLRYAFSSNLGEVYRNAGNLTLAIKERNQAIEYLPYTTYKPERRLAAFIHETIRNGSDYMGLFKHTCTKKGLRKVLALKYYLYACYCFAVSVLKTRIWRTKLTDFDIGTFTSMLYFECADFFHFIVEGLFYLTLLYATKSSRKFITKILKFFIPIVARISVFFYRLSLQIPLQKSSWFFFQKHRLAEVIMHSRTKNFTEVNRLIEEAKKFFEWGRELSMEFSETEGIANLGCCLGIKMYYEGNLQEAIGLFIKTFETYKTENHKAGMIKAMLWQAVCQEKMGNINTVRKILSEMVNTLQNMNKTPNYETNF